MFDSGLDDDERILVFSTDECIQLLRDSNNWFADGTFKTTPLLFYQLYTIHVYTHERMIAAVYALLPNKKQATY